VAAAQRDAKTAVDRGADMVEFRADYMAGLQPGQVAALRRDLDVPAIFTVRSEAEGGDWRGDTEARAALFAAAAAAGFEYLDIELSAADLYVNLRPGLHAQVILSYHDFERTSAAALADVYRDMRTHRPDIVKIAAYAAGADDLWTLLDLLQRARRDRQEAIVIGMGTAGKSSRVMFPLLGGMLTYACLTETSTAAPGQYALQDLFEIYRRMGEKA
jgi:3-dehydroquinate dehydratase/shikimate dehydrogenase